MSPGIAQAKRKRPPGVDYYDTWKAVGKCVRCGGVRDGSLLACSPCRVKQQARVKAYRAARSNAGVCPYCGVAPKVRAGKCTRCWSRSLVRVDNKRRRWSEAKKQADRIAEMQELSELALGGSLHVTRLDLYVAAE